MILRLFCLLVFASLLPGSSQAQSAATGAAEIIPRYDVEIAVFKNIKVPKGGEFVLPVSSPGKSEAMFDLSSTASVEAAQQAGYELLATDEFRLLDIVLRLIESPRYELLLHAAWRQPGLEREQVMPVWIKGGQIFGNEYTSIDSKIELFENKAVDDATSSGEKTFEFNQQTLESQELQLLEQQGNQRPRGLYELEGKITIALSRYLHTYADLILRRPREPADPLGANRTDQDLLEASITNTRILDNHLLREHRRMRSKNLHYLDSPEFAMLILITPYEVAEGFEEAPIETDPESETPAVE